MVGRRGNKIEGLTERGDDRGKEREEGGKEGRKGGVSHAFME